MKDSNNAELATLSTVTAASASVDLIKNGDIEANDRISLKLTDADGTAVNITTSALSADASVADIVEALNRASAATAVNFASIASDTITATGHGYETGDRVKFNAHGGLAYGLTDGAEYFVVKLTANTFKIATTYANATASTAVTVTRLQVQQPTQRRRSIQLRELVSMFATDTNADGDVVVASRIVITRADERILESHPISLGTIVWDSAIHENVTLDSPEISSTSTALTQNGNGGYQTTIEELVSAECL